MDERSELQLARELAALREKHRFYRVWENTLKPTARAAAAVPKTRRPLSAVKGSRRDSAPNAADNTTATTGHSSPLFQCTIDELPARASSPLQIEEPVSRGRVRPRSAPASRTRRKPSVQLITQQQPPPTGHSSNSSNHGGRISEELLRQQIARKKQEDQTFARELVGEMRAIAAEYLAMAEDANRFAGMLGIHKAFSLCDQQSLVAEPAANAGSHRHFDESKVLFSSKLLIKVEHPGSSSQPPRYLSLTAFTKEYNALKTKVQRQLEVLPASEAKTMIVATERMFGRRNSRDNNPGQFQAPALVLATASVARATTAKRNDEEMDDQTLEARFRQLLDDTIERRQQIDEQLQLLKELGWNTFR